MKLPSIPARRHPGPGRRCYHGVQPRGRARRARRRSPAAKSTAPLPRRRRGRRDRRGAGRARRRPADRRRARRRRRDVDRRRPERGVPHRLRTARVGLRGHRGRGGHEHRHGHGPRRRRRLPRGDLRLHRHVRQDRRHPLVRRPARRRLHGDVPRPAPTTRRRSRPSRGTPRCPTTRATATPSLRPSAFRRSPPTARSSSSTPPPTRSSFRPRRTS